MFRGSPRAHGIYHVQPGDPGTKQEGRRWTAKSPATDDLFEGHLEGRLGLGAVPLLLDPPGHTWWGAIDIDVYSLDVPAFARLCFSRGIPAVVCRTKSGGVHLYVFFVEPVPTGLVRSTLRQWAGIVGYPDAEVFPKQDLLSEQESDGDSYWGNWINLPYQSGDRTTTRYALGNDGRSLSLGQFLDVAETSRLDRAYLEDYAAPEAAPSDDLPGAPPCLLRMAQGVTSGRNQALFTAALYFKKTGSLQVQERVDAFNQSSMMPPLSQGEVITTVRAALKKDYNYRCKEQPMASLCDKDVCEDCAFGVAFGRNSRHGSEIGLKLGPLVKILTQPPIWRWQVNDEWIELTTQELTNQKLFLLRVVEVTSARTRPLKPRAWEALLDDVIPAAPIEVPPADATADGQLMHHLTRFCHGRAQAKTKDELLLSKPYTDPETKRSCFVVSDLLAYLAQQRVTGITEKWVYARLRDRDLQFHVEVLKGRPVAYWSLPPLDRQTEDFEVPRVEPEPQF